MTSKEFKFIVDKELAQAVRLLVALLPKSYSLSQREKIGKVCEPIIGIVVVSVIKGLKEVRREHAKNE